MGDHEATLSECVRLLSSESRERKFMGMVLVTKLVPGLDQDALVAVAEADGFARFLTSMLRATAVVNTAQDGSSDGEGDLDDGLLDAMDANHVTERPRRPRRSRSPRRTRSRSPCAPLSRDPRRSPPIHRSRSAFPSSRRRCDARGPGTPRCR